MRLAHETVGKTSTRGLTGFLLSKDAIPDCCPHYLESGRAASCLHWVEIPQGRETKHIFGLRTLSPEDS